MAFWFGCCGSGGGGAVTDTRLDLRQHSVTIPPGNYVYPESMVPGSSTLTTMPEAPQDWNDVFIVIQSETYYYGTYFTNSGLDIIWDGPFELDENDTITVHYSVIV